jgi:hypothetical protein
MVRSIGPRLLFFCYLFHLLVHFLAYRPTCIMVTQTIKSDWNIIQQYMQMANQVLQSKYGGDTSSEVGAKSHPLGYNGWNADSQATISVTCETSAIHEWTRRVTNGASEVFIPRVCHKLPEQHPAHPTQMLYAWCALHMRDIRVAMRCETRRKCASHALHPTWEVRFLAWVTFGQYCIGVTIEVWFQYFWVGLSFAIISIKPKQTSESHRNKFILLLQKYVLVLKLTLPNKPVTFEIDVYKSRNLFERNKRKLLFHFQHFHGNRDQNTVVTNLFHQVVEARCVELRVTKHHGANSALRLELLGCSKFDHGPQLPYFKSIDKSNISWMETFAFASTSRLPDQCITRNSEEGRFVRGPFFVFGTFCPGTNCPRTLAYRNTWWD